MVADLDGGWRELTKGWGFWAEDNLDYRDESKFQCRLYFLAKAPDSYESRKTFHERYLLEPIRRGRISISLHGMNLEVDVPLTQGWRRDKNGRPLIHEIEEDVFSVETSEGSINYRLQIWVTFFGRSSMFVPDQREWGDGFAWVGGRPESNRQKF